MSRTAYESGIGDKPYDQWRNNLYRNSATASYWFTIIYLEILLFMFVCGIKDGDFKLFNYLPKISDAVDVCFGSCALCKMAFCLHRRYDKILGK